MKFTGPKAKRCRRQGSNLYGSDKYDRVLQNKPYGAGKGPRTRGSKPTEYAVQLLEKQKVRDTFGVSEKQFKRYYKEAQKTNEPTGAMILRSLETRLDNVIYRAGFAVTRIQSRQMAGHGLFHVNGRRCSIPSRMVRPGDILEVRPRSAGSILFANNIIASEKYLPPSWLKVDSSKLKVEILSLPQEENFEQGLDIQKVIELYSR